MSRYSAKFADSPVVLAELKKFDRRRAYSPTLAIEGAALLLAQLKQLYDGNVDAALTHYNAGGRMGRYVKLYGHAGAKSRGLLTESQSWSYVPAVLEYKRKFDGGWLP